MAESKDMPGFLPGNPEKNKLLLFQTQPSFPHRFYLGIIKIPVCYFFIIIN